MRENIPLWRRVQAGMKGAEADAKALRISTAMAREVPGLKESNAALAEQAIRDPLTGLLNRRGFDMRMEEIMKSRRPKPLILEKKRGDDPERGPVGERRKPKHAVVIYFDVDDFKRFNEEQGHDAGDMVLKEIGKLLTSGAVITREGDFAARYGGEEFIVVLPEEMDVTGGVMVAERIRKGIETLNLIYENKPITVHASFGVSSTETAASLDEMIKQADDALHSAKAMGKNTVVSFGSGNKLRGDETRGE